MLHSWLILAAVLLAIAVLLTAAMVVAMSQILLRPQRMTDGRAAALLHRLSPGDLSMPYERLNFRVRDERSGKSMNIASWWMPCPAGGSRCAVLIHGYGDAKVGGIAWAPTLSDLGFHVLAIDLRAHGESDGTYSTGGYFERHDVGQVINEIRAHRPDETKTLVLFGVSLGAAVAVATADLRDDIAAVVLESPFADYRAIVMRHGELMKLPGPTMQRAAIALAQRLSGARFDEVRPIDLIPRLRCAVMVIQGCEDELVPENEAARVAAAVNENHQITRELWCIPGAGHALSLHANAVEYARKLKAFFDANLPPGDRDPLLSSSIAGTS